MTFYKQSNIRRRFDAGVQILTDAQRRLLVRVANKTISFISRCMRKNRNFQIENNFYI